MKQERKKQEHWAPSGCKTDLTSEFVTGARLKRLSRVGRVRHNLNSRLASRTSKPSARLHANGLCRFWLRSFCANNQLPCPTRKYRLPVHRLECGTGSMRTADGDAPGGTFCRTRQKRPAAECQRTRKTTTER